MFRISISSRSGISFALGRNDSFIQRASYVRQRTEKRGELEESRMHGHNSPPVSPCTIRPIKRYIMTTMNRFESVIGLAAVLTLGACETMHTPAN